MKKLYFVFDQFPRPQSGGLLGMYKNIFKELKDQYDICIVEVFKSPDFHKDAFSDYQFITLHHYSIDSDFVDLLSYLKALRLIKFIKALWNMMIYFISIPFSRRKAKHLFEKDALIVATSPSAAIFLHHTNQFILEIHTKYEYFFEGTLASRLQIKFMTDPSLIIFRSSADALKAKNKGLNAGYIYNFADSPLKKDELSDSRKGYLFLGRLAPSKNLFELADIFNQVHKENQDIYLDIYGTGVVEESLKDYIDDHRFNDFIHLKGFTVDKEVYLNYKALVSASRLEGLPLNILEAKRCGIPVVSYSWGESTAEVIHNGKDGYIAENQNDFKDKVLLLDQNDQLLMELSKNAFDDYQRFSPKSFIVKYIEFLENYK